MKAIYGFLACMWGLILLGGGIAVLLLGPITITGFGEFDAILSSGIKGGTAIILVILWVLVLYKIKNWIFAKQIRT